MPVHQKGAHARDKTSTCISIAWQTQYAHTQNSHKQSTTVTDDKINMNSLSVTTK